MYLSDTPVDRIMSLISHNSRPAKIYPTSRKNLPCNHPIKAVTGGIIGIRKPMSVKLWWNSGNKLNPASPYIGICPPIPKEEEPASFKKRASFVTVRVNSSTTDTNDNCCISHVCQISSTQLTPLHPLINSIITKS